MVAKKTASKKPATKKTEKSVKSVKAVKSVKTTKPVVKEVMPATDKKCECGCNCGCDCKCSVCGCNCNRVKSFIVLLIVIAATVFATLVAVGPCHKRGPKGPCPCEKMGKPDCDCGKGRCKKAGCMKDMPAPAPMAEAK